MKLFDSHVIQRIGWPVLLFTLGLFSTGFHLVSILTWVYLPCVIYYARRGWKQMAVATLRSVFSTTIAFLSVLDANVDGPRFQGAYHVVGVFLLFNIPFAFSLAADQVAKDANCIWLRTFTFPTIWTGVWMLLSTATPIGDAFAFSNAVSEWPDLIQIVSVGGPAAAEFLLAWFASSLFELFFHDTTLDEENTGGPAKDTAPVLKQKTFLHPLQLWGLVTFAACVFGGVTLNTRPGAFFQKQHAEFVPPSTPVGCLVGSKMGSALQNNHTYWLDKTAKMAESGARLVLWSEQTVIVKDMEERTTFFDMAREVAKTHSIYLGVSYDQLEPVRENKVTLFTPDGDIAIDFNKAHPVPFLEPQEPGVRKVPYVDTKEFGRVGLAICHDYSFPGFISQASKYDIDVMLQPVWTWGPTARYYTKKSSIRALENGFTLFRCASHGVSGIFEPTSASMFTQQVGTLTDQKLIFALPLQKRIMTLYSYIGNSFGYGCLISGVVCVTYLLVLKHRKDMPLQI